MPHLAQLSLLTTRSKLPHKRVLAEIDVVGKRVERRLSAILFADVAGYSRLVGKDEEGTLAQ
jgi:class 3 adenylate cyclase